MKFIVYKGLDEYEPWCGAKYAYNKIKEAGKLEELDEILEDMYPDGMELVELNDLLWFDEETVYEWLGMKEEEDEEDD